MLQKDMLLPYRTVVDNVALPMIIKGVKKKEARQIASKYFEQFGLEGTQKLYPAELSGGMRQRAALLRTYLFSGDVALLDEPFSALDTLTKGEMHRWYLDVMDDIKLSTIFITHDIDEAILLSDRIYLLSGKPGTITDEIVIDEPKPRRKNFNLSEDFLRYKREIISKIQNMRKEVGFEVMDLITIYANGNQKIENIMSEGQKEILTDVMATKVVTGTMEGFSKEWNINGEKVTLGVKKNQ